MIHPGCPRASRWMMKPLWFNLTGQSDNYGGDGGYRGQYYIMSDRIKEMLKTTTGYITERAKKVEFVNERRSFDSM